MLFATANQGALWLWMMACGVVIGVWYLITALLRRFVQAGFWLTLIIDLVFGAGCAALFILFLVFGNYGQLRLFEIFAAAAGAAVFALAVYAPLKRMEFALKKGFSRIWTWLSGNHLIKVIFR